VNRWSLTQVWAVPILSYAAFLATTNVLVRILSKDEASLRPDAIPSIWNTSEGVSKIYGFDELVLTSAPSSVSWLMALLAYNVFHIFLALNAHPNLCSFRNRWV
jgi:hypothetical protein